jgi:hypothetical protein
MKTLLTVATLLVAVSADAAPRAALCTKEVPNAHLRYRERQAETLIKSHGPSSGFDGVHTALHGYLEAACKDVDIEFSEDASITTLFSLLREKHPSLILVDADEPLALKILRSLSKIIDAKLN